MSTLVLTDRGSPSVSLHPGGIGESVALRMQSSGPIEVGGIADNKPTHSKRKPNELGSPLTVKAAMEETGRRPPS
jgi:hypothetical protein